MGSTNADGAQEKQENDQPHPLLIVGIGASAGGLEALEHFFSHVPAGSGLAYVVIQHLAPQHASMLTQLLGRQTEMPVVEAKDGMTPQADHVYVIAPGTLLEISGGAFQVKTINADRHGQIDAFLRTLAEDRGEHAIGIVLSGSGGDGTDGLRAIQAHGGLTLAQTPETAKYDNMPKAAIEARVVGEVLAPEAMPVRLLERARRLTEGRGPIPMKPPPKVVTPRAVAPSSEELAGSLDWIYEILLRATGHDFSGYKRGTVLRRLGRRIQMRGSVSLSAYLDFLDTDAEEPEILAKDLLIGVTQFFRDPEAFEYLGLYILPRLLASGDADRNVRIWVPGCASGEEAYSLGILLREHLAVMSLARRVQIFATDIDAEAIAEARLARYPIEIAQHVSPNRLARYFTRDGSFYQIVKEVREMCIFSEHSLIRDPPFLGLHLISCRNVLIYLEAELQKRLVPVFHYALAPDGYLFLGSSEGLASHPDLFEVVDKRFRIFKRSEIMTQPPVDFPLANRPAPRVAPPSRHVPAPPPIREKMVNTAFERLMLQEYVPPGAVVNAHGDVICIAGLTGRYLQPPAGVLSTNLLDIAHAGLRIELRTALHAAVRSGKRVIRDNVSIEVDGSPRRLRLTVRPLPGVTQDGLFAVILQERAGGEEEAAEPSEPAAFDAEAASAVEQLESELRKTRADLRATIEEVESTNEELKSSNEELLSTNEEMQSANEELQSSQEELKSVNEELATVNTELVRKVEELGRANSDLSNLFSSTDIATLFLDRELRVARFTPAAKALFRLIEADIGRPLSDLAPRFADQDLTAEVSGVLRTLRPLERQVATIDRQAWYLLRVLPYRTDEDIIAGAVVTLTDIAQIKRTEEERERAAGALRKAQEQLSADLDATSRLLKIGSLFLQEGNLSAVLNQILDAAIAVSGADFGNIQLLDRASGDLKIAAQRGFPASWVEFWDSVARGQGACGTALERRAHVIIEDVEASPIFAGTPALVIQRQAGIRAVQSTPLLGRAQEPLGMLSTHYRTPTVPSDRALRGLDLIARQASDILERARAEEALRQSEESLLEADRRKNEFLAMLSHELRNPLAAILTSSHVLDRTAPGGPQARRAQAVITRQVGHLIRLIDDVLDITRITRGKILLQRERLDLNELAQRAIDDHREAFHEGGIALEVLPAPAPLWVNGDPARLSQVISNLLHNAVKFTPRGGKATVSVEASTARGQAIVRVQDTGRGIAKENLKRVFEPFSQAEPTLDRSKGGLGLGLAVVKGLVEMHGGSVDAASGGPGEGTTFTIALPLEPTGPTETPRPRASVRAAPRRVLIIEDNLDAAQSLRDVLELAGHVVEVAHTGPEGIERAKSFNPELVLCDIGLPGMDGYEVARTLRADPLLGRVMLVALSGYAATADVAKAVEAGFDTHLAKPPGIQALEDLLARAKAHDQGRNGDAH